MGKEHVGKVYVFVCPFSFSRGFVFVFVIRLFQSFLWLSRVLIRQFVTFTNVANCISQLLQIILSHDFLRFKKPVKTVKNVQYLVEENKIF